MSAVKVDYIMPPSACPSRPPVACRLLPLSVAAAVLLLLLSGCAGEKKSSSLHAQYQRALKMTNAETRGTELVKVAYQQEQAGDILGAEQSLAAAAQAGREVQDPVGRAKVLNLAAYAQGSMRRAGDAKKLLSDVRDAAGKIEDKSERSQVLTKMAVTYARFLDNAAAAKSYLQEGEQLAAEIEPAGRMVAALVKVADNYGRADLPEDAQRVAQRADEAARAIEDPRQRADALGEVAALRHKLGQSEQASETFAAASAAATEIQDDLSRAYALVNLANHLAGSGDKPAARQAIQQAEQAADKVADQSMRGPLMTDIVKTRQRL